MAAAVVAHTDSTKQDLRANGYPADQIALIPPGAQVLTVRTAKSRYQARLALGDANHDLSVAEYSPIVVCVDRLVEGRGLTGLIAAWESVANRWPSAKLWIIGDGSDRSRLYESIVDRQLHHQVFLPGSFDELDEVFQAADLYVAPAEPAEHTSTLLAAMAAGLPVIAGATRGNRAMMDSGVHGLLIAPGDQRALSVAISQVLENPSLGTQLGDAARRRVNERYSLLRVAQDHLGLFTRLTASQRGKR
jgi:glycosyltransferase involved in cell wall biosynthesis